MSDPSEPGTTSPPPVPKTPIFAPPPVPRTPTKEKRKQRQTPTRKTLLQRKDQATRAGYGAFPATIVHIVADRALHEASHDPFYLALVLLVFLVYLYTRQWEWVLVWFVIYYIIENVCFFGARAFHPFIGTYIQRYESRSDELLTDPIIFLITLATASYVYEASVFQTAAVPAGALRTFFVASVAMLSAFSRLYFVSLFLTMAAVWIVYFTQSSVPESLEQALVATLTVGCIFLWFIRPINCHYLFNAIYLVLFTLFFAGLLTGIQLNA